MDFSPRSVLPFERGALLRVPARGVRLCGFSLLIVQGCQLDERPRRARGRLRQPLQLGDGSRRAAARPACHLYELLEDLGWLRADAVKTDGRSGIVHRINPRIREAE